MKFAFIAKHRAVWPVAWMYAALGVSRSGFHAWLTRQPSQRTRDDEAILSKAHASFVARMKPVPMCSITSSASTIRRGGTRPWAISALSSSKTEPN